jgi:hypothetical protein
MKHGETRATLESAPGESFDLVHAALVPPELDELPKELEPPEIVVCRDASLGDCDELVRRIESTVEERLAHPP